MDESDKEPQHLKHSSQSSGWSDSSEDDESEDWSELDPEVEQNPTSHKSEYISSVDQSTVSNGSALYQRMRANFKPLPFEEEAKIARLAFAKNRDGTYVQSSDVRKRAREKLSCHMIDKIFYQAQRFCSGRCTIATDLDDLFSVGYCSLTKALDNYKLHSGVPFSSFARHYVLGAIREHIRSYRRTVHVPKNSDSDRKSLERCTNEFIAQHDGRSPTDAELAVDLGWEAAQVSSVKSSLEALSSPLQISESTDEVYSGQMSPEDDRAPDAYAESKLLLQRAASILQRMRTRESNVIILRHGLDGEIALSNREVATILNTTPAEIENIYNNGIRRFRILNAQLQHNPRDERAAVEAVQGVTKLLADNLRRVAGIRRKRYMAIALTVLDSNSRTCSLKDFMTAVAGAISRAKLKAFSRDRFDNDSSEAAYFGIQHLLQAGCIATSADGEFISMTEKGDAWLGAYRHRI